MKTNRCKLSALICVYLIIVSSVFAQSSTRIQVMYTSDNAKAESISQKLDALGYGPAKISKSNNGFKVLSRTYNSYDEVSNKKVELEKAGFKGAFIVSDSPQKQQFNIKDEVFGLKSVIETGEMKKMRIDFQTKKKPFKRPEMTDFLRNLDAEKAGEKDLFTKSMAFRKRSDVNNAIKSFDAYIRRFPKSEDTPKAKMMRGYWILEKKNWKKAMAQFEAIAKEYPENQIAGEAHLRCAYIMLLERCSVSDVLRRFLKVAKSEVPSEPEIRIEAMIRCAALYYKMRNLDTAEAAYLAIEKAATDPEVQSFALMQRAGIVLEKGYNGEIPYSESRALCDEVIKKYPGVNKQTRATAALMAIESLCREKNYEEVVNRADIFFNELLDTPESPLAHFWIAKAYRKTGNPKLAAELLEDVITNKKKAKKRFRHIALEEKSRKLASKVYEEIGNKKRAKSILLKD
jgi:TolA-binding protein